MSRWRLHFVSTAKHAFAAFSVLCLAVPQSRAWNAEGHMIAAQVAYNHLQPSVKTNCDALIAVILSNTNIGTTNFVTAACWADDFKSQLGTGIWHYIDLPFSLDGSSTNSFTPDSFDVVQAIRQCTATLGNLKSTQTDRATALRYLIHFVGDIHQPLHASTAITSGSPQGDAGGNGFLLTGTWGNLHSLWDAGGGYLTDSVSRPLSSTARTTISNKAAAVEALYPYVSNSGVVVDPITWALEGWNLAQTVSYVGITEGTTPSSAYTNSVQSTTKARMALAGQRLADLLNTVLGHYPVTLQPSISANGTLTFWWNAVPGRTYHIQTKQNVDDTWTDLYLFASASNVGNYTDSAGVTAKFFRVTE